MTDYWNLPNTWDVLRKLVADVKCKPSWRFTLSSEDGPLELLILVTGPDSRGVHVTKQTIAHHFPVPIATYNKKSWRRWVFECCRKVEDHELGEWFLDGTERPFAPLHGPGEDPTIVHEFRDVVDAHTNQDGTVRS